MSVVYDLLEFTMSSSPEVAAFSGLISIVVVALTWRLEGDPMPWRRVAKVGTAYRETEYSASIAVPASIQIARTFAWLVVAVCALHVVIMLGAILLQEGIRYTTSIETSTFSETPPERPPPEHFFDTFAATLYAISMMLSAGVIGSFARWAKDAAKDLAQARRPMPIAAAGLLTVATVFIQVALKLRPAPSDSPGNMYPWPIALAYMAVVLFGAALVAIGRRAALRVE